MAMFAGELAGTAKADVPRYAVDGKRALVSNPTGLPTADILENGCEGCPLMATHRVAKHCALVVPFGEKLRQRVPVQNKLTAQELARLQAALHQLQYVVHGNIGNDVPYNAAGGGATDGADNASQVVTYEILSASGNTLTLKGPNPRFIQFSRSVLNPNYPLLAPPEMRPPGLTDEEWDGSEGETAEEDPPYYPGAGWARFINQPVVMSMPLGASVEFPVDPLTPDRCSVLAKKMRPMVKAINPPALSVTDLDDVEFTIEVDQDVGRAMQPFDLSDVPETYYCGIRWDALYPSDWRHFVDYPEVLFTRREATMATGEIHDLLNAVGGQTRVLFPGMITSTDGSTALDCKLMDGEVEVRAVDVLGENSPITGLPRLRTVEDGDGWISTMDLRGLESEGDRCAVTFYPEDVASSDGSLSIRAQATCSNAFPDASYAQDDGWRCGSPESAGFPTFKKVCWRPSTCNGFAVGDRTQSWRADESGPEIYLPHRWGDAAWWAKVWSGIGWVFEQTSIDPFDGLLINRGGGFSIGSLFGRFIQQAPIVGGVLSKEPWFPPAFGERFAWEGSSGKMQRLAHGAFCRQGWDETADGGHDILFDPAASRDHPGIASAAVSGWATRNDAMGAAPSDLAEYPARLGAAVLGTMTGTGGSFAAANELLDDVDGAVVGVALDEVDEDLDAYIAARFST